MSAVEFVQEPRSEPTFRARLADIVTLASRLSNVDRQTIVGQDRDKHLVQIRGAISLVAREQTPVYSYPHIGRSLGGRDHSTIINCIKNAQYLVDHDYDYRAFVQNLREAAAEYEPFVEDENIFISWTPPQPVKMPAAEKPAPSPIQFNMDDADDQDPEAVSERLSQLATYQRMAESSAMLLAAIQQARAA